MCGRAELMELCCKDTAFQDSEKCNKVAMMGLGWKVMYKDETHPHMAVWLQRISGWNTEVTRDVTLFGLYIET